MMHSPGQGKGTSWLELFWRIDLAGLAICALLTAAGYGIGVRPLLMSRDERVAQRDALAQSKANVASIAALTRSLRTQLSETRLALARLNVDLQPPGEINARLADLTSLASDCRLEVQSLQPAALAGGTRVSQIPIQLSAAGSYRMCAEFLHRLRGRFPDTAIRGLELSANPTDPAALVSLNLQLAWYVQPAAKSVR